MCNRCARLPVEGGPKSDESRRLDLTPRLGQGINSRYFWRKLVANVPSAEKRNRQRLKRRQRNLAHKTRMRTYEKRLRSALSVKDPKQAQDALSVAISALAKADRKSVV